MRQRRHNLAYNHIFAGSRNCPKCRFNCAFCFTGPAGLVFPVKARRFLSIAFSPQKFPVFLSKKTRGHFFQKKSTDIMPHSWFITQICRIKSTRNISKGKFMAFNFYFFEVWSPYVNFFYFCEQNCPKIKNNRSRIFYPGNFPSAAHKNSFPENNSTPILIIGFPKTDVMQACPPSEI